MSGLDAPLTTVALWGENHEQLGKIGVKSIDDRVTIALSRGRFPKAYPHLDANEDAVVAASDGMSWMMAVADGHSGFDAARAAMERVLRMAPDLLGGAISDPTAALRRAFAGAREAVADTVKDLDEPRCFSRTALSIVLVSPDRVAAAGQGDTVVVRARGGEATSSVKPVEFLGPDPIVNLPVSVEPRRPGEVIILATDGLYDFLGRGWLERLGRLARPQASPAEIAEQAVEAAFAGGSGDNVACGVLKPSVF